MKPIILILGILLLAFEFAYSQSQSNINNGIDSVSGVKMIENSNGNSSEVIPVYFILGTLSDYIGRFYAVDRSQQVDRYDGPEKPLVDYLETMIKEHTGMKVDSLIEKRNNRLYSSDILSKRYLLYSDELAKALNNFYGKDDHLIDSLFTTNEQIYSFLAGVYYRYGDRLDSSICKIQMANSSKHINCKAFLERVGCKKVVYKHLNNIPAQNILYFIPTEELLSYFNGIERQKMLLREYSIKAYQEIFKDTFSKEEFEKGFLDIKAKELNGVKGEFK